MLSSYGNQYGNWFLCNAGLADRRFKIDLVFITKRFLSSQSVLSYIHTLRLFFCWTTWIERRLDVHMRSRRRVNV